jgi:membrane protease YdiL (CAAX protease family)
MTAAARERGKSSEASSGVGSTIAVTAACFVLLLFRSELGISTGATVAALAGMYGVILLASVGTLVPSAAEHRMSPLLVAAVGMSAVLAASAAAGPPLSTPRTSWAVPLALGAAVSEEAFFRRFLYGTLLRYGAVLAIVGSAMAFAAVHIPMYGGAAFWVDLGAGLLLSWQRWASGRWAVPALTHAFANLVVLFR